MIPIGEYLSQNARRLPEKEALVSGGRRWTYAELDRETSAIAATLVAQGVRPGDRIGIIGAASGDWVRLAFGITRCGGVIAALNYRETPDRVARMMADVGVTRLFADPSSAKALAAEQLECPVSDLTRDAVDGMAQGDEPGDIAVSPDGGAVILFTGGTTGLSKGVLLSHANLFWNVINQVQGTRMDESDRTLIGTALHHSAAFNTWLLPTLYLGGTAIVLPEFTPEGWIEAVGRDGVTNGFTPPTMIRQILSHPLAARTDWSQFRRWYSGAGGLSAEDRAAMEALVPGVGIYYEYGLTEAGPIVTCLRPEDYERAAPNSIGRAVRHCDIRILREDRGTAGTGEAGEIAVRGPMVMSGYVNRPEETAKTFHDDWLLTGDLATMDENGFITFLDRSKDMIKTGGLNVYSQEVEQVLADHPAIREVAVLGFNDDTWGERVTAVVVLRDGASASERELIDFARSRLGGYQTPKSVVFLPFDALPRNYLGKILKRDLRIQLEAEE
ncbi:AMP-binding protein [Cognatishimia sp. D5M38]|jgi:fatty-acyl-CoA synthase|uniref:AMP-binding protein n=1 Tax=Cognatishimia coralii TaxID=3083254 RepID=A0ABU8QK29_9RHOB|nr:MULTISPECIES: AMP-binding protein [Roseobacteraceae]MCI5038161.1 AMP-binding protein [Donghicola eburneus]MDD9722809.1 AMP-binding protein [Sulfitobacter sp. PR48]